MKFIFKIFKFISTIFIAFIVFTYLFSLKSDMSFKDSIGYFETVAKQVLDIDNFENIVTNSNVDYTQIITSSNKYFYYEQLDDNGKIIYTALDNNLNKLKEENYVIDFSTTFNDLLNTTTGQYKLNKAFQSALDAFFYDHPELFYLDLSNFSLNTKCISIGALKTYTVEIAPKNNSYLHSNFNSKQKVNVAINTVEKIKNNIINTVYEYNTYEKIKYVHDMLVNSIEYDSNKQNIHNIYGALVDKKVVCEGYAKAFKYLMDELDIECILVSGVATNSSGKEESHMWNYVRLNNEWYGVDVTWDDPIIDGGTYKNNLRHNYFLKGRKTFNISHSSSGKISESGMFFTLPILSNNNYKK